jgi:transposase
MVTGREPPVVISGKLEECAAAARHKLLQGGQSMTGYREILRLSAQGISQRSIAKSCECSRNTVATVLKQADQQGIAWDAVRDLTDGEVYCRLFPTQIQPGLRKLPDCEYVHREMAKSGVTLSLLWNEYCDQCRINHEIPFKYTQFCHYYRQFVLKTRATMHISRKPGDQTEVDWAGQTAAIVDRDTGEIIPACVFVAVLSYSQYAYVEAFLRQDMESWITAHVNTFRFFGGATRILTPVISKLEWTGSPGLRRSLTRPTMR